MYPSAPYDVVVDSPSCRSTQSKVVVVKHQGSFPLCPARQNFPALGSSEKILQVSEFGPPIRPSPIAHEDEASPPPLSFRTCCSRSTAWIVTPTLSAPFDAMFSVVLPGRLPLAAPQQVDDTHCVFTLDEASTINHVVVFMTGIQPFPPGFSATVHLLWPSSNAQEWKLLGCIRNSKPSAIFKVNPPSSPAATATLGISIEPDALVDEQIATLPSATATGTGAGAKGGEALDVAPKIARNAFAYLSSFAPDSAPQTAPLLQKWLEQLERKLRTQGPAFLDKQE